MKKQLLFILTALGLAACGGPEDQQERPHDVKVPLVINGVRYSPEEVNTLFADAKLSFFIDKEAQEQGFVYAFTNEVDRLAFRERWLMEHPREVQQSSVEDSTFYEHINNAGASFTLAAHTAEPDLRSVCRWYWYGYVCTNWNDRISSVTPSRVNRITTLHEHINLGEPTYDMPNSVTQVNLTDVGWNDRASSISYTY